MISLVTELTLFRNVYIGILSYSHSLSLFEYEGGHHAVGETQANILLINDTKIQFLQIKVLSIASYTPVKVIEC